MKKSTKLVLMHLGIAAIVAVYFLLTHFLNTGCLIKYVIKYPCPTCGMTRAMLSLFTLDFAGYVAYNVMALPMLVGILLAIHIKKKWLIALVVVIAVVNLAYFIARLVLGTIL